MVLDIQGEWHLVASASTNSEIEFIGEEPDPNGITNWLNGFDDTLVDSAKSTSGLVLTIQSDGTFAEYYCNQDDLEHTLQALLNYVHSGRLSGGRAGPPIPGAFTPA